LAASISRIRQWPVAPLLRRTRQTAPQTRVAPSQRKGNIKNAFQACRVDLSGWGHSGRRCKDDRFNIDGLYTVAAVADAMGANFTIK